MKNERDIVEAAKKFVLPLYGLEKSTNMQHARYNILKTKKESTSSENLATNRP